MTSPPISLSDDRQQLGLLIFAILLVVAPHVLNLAPMVMLYFALLVFWRIAGLYLNASLPKGLYLFLFTLAGAVIVLEHYRRFWGQEAGSGLLIVGLGLKMLELKTKRDGYLLVFLAFFVILTQYLFSQSIPMAVYTMSVLVLLVAAMIGFNSNAEFPVFERLKMAGFLVSLAIPFMALMFVVFPRLPGPLWQFPEFDHQARTGLGDSLSPGAINHLAKSKEPVFRVDFEGEPPPNKLLYWRGPVFWYTNGVNWSMLPENFGGKPIKPRFGQDAVRYAVTLEPSGRRWVYALELPISIPEEFSQTRDFQLLARQDLGERLHYRLTSGAGYQTGPLSEDEARMALQLPKNVSARVRELVTNWSGQTSNPGKLVELALNFFREENFFYTLNPPLLEGDPVDRFLFETRRGFCEHYATSFVILMRLAGIPSRVVTGYQGGQWNSFGNFLEVSQADAHAWAEVWLPDQGWSRVDPTAAVAPQRIEQGLDVESQAAAQEIRFNFGNRELSGAGLRFEELWRWGRMAVSGINHVWDTLVLAYGPENQEIFMRWLGLFDWRILAGWLSLALSVFLAVSVWLILPHKPPDLDPAQQAYRNFLEKLSRWGVTRNHGEGALTFARRLADSSPHLAAYASPITRLYLRIRYERTHSPEDIDQLHRLVAEIPAPKESWWARRLGGQPSDRTE